MNSDKLIVAKQIQNQEKKGNGGLELKVSAHE